MLRIWIERLPGIARAPVGEDEPTSRHLCAIHRQTAVGRNQFPVQHGAESSIQRQAQAGVVGTVRPSWYPSRGYGEIIALARRYDVDHHTITDALNGVTWGEVLCQLSERPIV